MMPNTLTNAEFVDLLHRQILNNASLLYYRPILTDRDYYAAKSALYAAEDARHSLVIHFLGLTLILLTAALVTAI